MKTKNIVHIEEEGIFIGWFDDLPDYKTQGETLVELKENLLDIKRDREEVDQCR